MRGDPGRLQQIIWNLISNATKFTPKNGRIQVALSRVNSHVEMTVTDSGQEIEAAFLPHVFERFRQADSSNARDHGGLRIGLAIVRQLTELHGGRVRAASAGPAQGATFTVELPLTAIRSVPPGERVHPRRWEDATVPGAGADLRGMASVYYSWTTSSRRWRVQLFCCRRRAPECSQHNPLREPGNSWRPTPLTSC